MVRRDDSDEARQERERQRLIEEAKKNPKPSINKADAYIRGIFGAISGNEQILTALIKGSNEDFLEVSSNMSDAELAGDIAFFVAFSLAGRVGNKLGKMNSKGGKTTSFERVSQYAKSKGFKLAPDIKPKVNAEIDRVNRLGDSQQQEGLLRIRESKLQAAKDLLKNVKDKTEKFKLKADIEGIKRSIQQGAKDLNDAKLREQVESLNKLDPNIQFKIENGKIVKALSEVELANIAKAEEALQKTKLENQAITDENLRQAKQLVEEGNRREQLAKEAREKAKAEDKAIDEDPIYDIDEKGLPDEVIETKEKTDVKDKPDFGDTEGTENNEPLIDRAEGKTDEQIIDEAIDKAEAKARTDSTTSKVAGGAAGAAVVTNALVNALSNDGDDNNDDPNFEDGDEEPPVIPMDLVEEGGTITISDPGDPNDPSVPIPPKPSIRDKALSASISSYNHNAQTKPYNIKRTITSKNIDELFLHVLDLCEDSYMKETKFEVDKYFIDGNFPVLLNRSGDTIFVIFRGTNNNFTTYEDIVNSISNMITDMTTWDGAAVNQNIKYSTLVEQALLSEEARDLGAHIGFIKELAKYYKSIADEIQLYDSVCNHVVLGGHSAGGALATLFYYVYANDRNLKSKIPVEYCITYGSPRVLLNRHEFITQFNNSCPSYYRVFNVNDIVSYLPFNKGSVFDSGIASGFTHVGLPMCLDSNVDDNSLNALILQVVKGNYKAFDEIFLNYSLNEIRENKLIEFITSNQYLSLMGDSMFKCYQNVGTRRDVSDEMILFYARELMSEGEKLLDYGLKCDLLEPLTISDMLKQNNIGENVEQENVTISSIGSMLLGFSKMSVEGHGFPKYRENLNKRVDREVLDKTPFLEPFTYENTLPKAVTPESVTIDMMASIQEDIDRGYILGVTPSEFKPGDIFIYK
jgi:hypothetical protein